MNTPYVAPARYVVTVLHRQNPDVPPVTTGPDPSDGMTRCGLPMLTAEIWQPVDGRDGERLCTGCMPTGPGPAPEPATEGVLF
jgi:hypothetical protein